MNDKLFTIGRFSTKTLSKKQLIELIEKNFTESFGNIAVLTECETKDFDGEIKTLTQSLTFGKTLDI